MAKSSKRVNGKSIGTGSATIHDQNLNRGEGGELHQIAQGDTLVLTTAQGGPVSDDQPLPEIDVSDQYTITIAVPIVSDVFFQPGSWNNRPIRYDIGHIAFPSPNSGETR